MLGLFFECFKKMFNSWCFDLPVGMSSSNRLSAKETTEVQVVSGQARGYCTKVSYCEQPGDVASKTPIFINREYGVFNIYSFDMSSAHAWKLGNKRGQRARMHARTSTVLYCSAFPHMQSKLQSTALRTLSQ